MKELICPVCKKEIKTKSHVCRVKDDIHIQYVKDQERLAFELYENHKIIEKVLQDNHIFLDYHIEQLLLTHFKDEIRSTNKKLCKERISIAMTNPNSEKFKFKKEYHDAITNGIENIDYVVCKVCGYKGRQLISHLTRIHKINKKKYLELYPDAMLNCLVTNEKISAKLMEVNTNHEEHGCDHNNFNNPWGISGHRGDLGGLYRSTWEANIARILKFHDIDYIYETRKLLDYNNGKLVYIVDFYLPKYNKYIEVKGVNNKRSQIKISNFKGQYKERLIVIDRFKYNLLKKKYKNKIYLWEDYKQNIKRTPEKYK